MISVCIPVYNRDVNRLAASLSAQLTTLPVAGELLIMDDGSQESFQQANQPLASLSHVRYVSSAVNQGRIRIRQSLAEKATYDWLLFLDGDSTVLSEQFLHRYVQLLPSVPAVVVGGRTYAAAPPAACSERLHWKYGAQREHLPAATRNMNPYAGFMSNNFLVHKSIFQQLRFVDDWHGYGHEDTWIGMQFEQLGVSVKYTDNPTMHDGVETTPVFLKKTEQALHNLARLEQLVSGDRLQKHVRLYRVYRLLRSLGLLWLPAALYTPMKGYIEKNLHSCNPSLRLFDLYRLVRFIKMRGGSRG